jgi:hypothetical protein
VSATTDPGPGGIVLSVTEAVELAALLGMVEDWLLHTDEAVLGDLARFLDPHAHPQGTRPLIDALGDAGVNLAQLLDGHRQAGQP